MNKAVVTVTTRLPIRRNLAGADADAARLNCPENAGVAGSAQT